MQALARSGIPAPAWGRGVASGKSLHTSHPQSLFCKIKRTSQNELILGFQTLVYVRCVHVCFPLKVQYLLVQCLL